METAVDSSVLVALFNTNDSQHEEAIRALERIPKPLYIHEYICAETATVLRLKISAEAAETFTRSLFENNDMAVLYASSASFAAAADAFISQAGHLSFFDCALLTLSDTHEILTFDRALARAIRKRARERKG